jgi:hypothetical protein
MRTRTAAAVLMTVGAILLGIAYAQATSIPKDADNDFFELVQAAGGSMTFSAPGFPEAYKQMSANRRLLQNAYIGFGGVALLTAGGFGLVMPVCSGKRSEG